MRLLISILLLFSTSVYAQRGLVLDALDNNVLNDDLLKSRYMEISGSPYFLSDFFIGTVEFTNKQKFENVPVRVDVFAGTVQLKRNSTIVEYDNKYVKSLILNGPEPSAQIRFKNIKIDGSRKFAVSYVDDKIKFFAVPDVERRISSSAQTSYSSTDQQDKFVSSVTYYIYLDGVFHEVKLNKKSILAVLGGGNDLQAYAKSNKIKFNKIEDVVKLINYYNDKT